MKTLIALTLAALTLTACQVGAGPGAISNTKTKVELSRGTTPPSLALTVDKSIALGQIVVKADAGSEVPVTLTSVGDAQVLNIRFRTVYADGKASDWSQTVQLPYGKAELVLKLSTGQARFEFEAQGFLKKATDLKPDVTLSLMANASGTEPVSLGTVTVTPPPEFPPGTKFPPEAPSVS